MRKKMIFFLSFFIVFTTPNTRADWGWKIIELVGGCVAITIYGIPTCLFLDWVSSKISPSGKPILDQIIDNPLIDKPQLSSKSQIDKPKLVEFNYDKYQTHCMTPALMANDIYSVHTTNSIEQEIENGTIARGDIIKILNKDGQWEGKGKNIESVRKRLIGLPGDRITGRIEDGERVIYLNGRKLLEPYVCVLDIVQIPSSDVPPETTERLGKKNYYTFIYNPYFLEKEKYYIGNNFDSDYRSDKYRNIYNFILDKKAKKEDVFDITLKEDEAWVMGDNRIQSYDSRFVGPVKIQNIVEKLIPEQITERKYYWYIMPTIVEETLAPIFKILYDIRDKYFPAYYNLAFHSYAKSLFKDCLAKFHS